MSEKMNHNEPLKEPIHPRNFIIEYVDPAIALWQKNQNVKHLAVHAIAQVDVLAEVVALWTLLAGRPNLDRDEAPKFRDDLGAREAALKTIRDAHDSHKHGALVRKTATEASIGQRPETVSAYPFTLTAYTYLVFVLNDRTETVSNMLDEAMKAWGRELTRLGL